MILTLDVEMAEWLALERGEALGAFVVVWATLIRSGNKNASQGDTGRQERATVEE
jgi:hypothetical protein